MLNKINHRDNRVALHHVQEQAKPVAKNSGNASDEKKTLPAPGNSSQVVHTVDKMRVFDGRGKSGAASKVDAGKTVLVSVDEVARKTQFSTENLRLIFTDTGLTDTGEKLILRLPLGKEADIKHNFQLRKDSMEARILGLTPTALAGNAENPPAQTESFSVLDPSFFEGLPEQWNNRAENSRLVWPASAAAPAENVTTPDPSFFEGLPEQWNNRAENSRLLRPASAAAPAENVTTPDPSFFEDLPEQWNDPVENSGRARSASTEIIDIVDVENYRPKAAVTAANGDVARTLLANSWLRDDDLLTCMNAMESQLRQLPGASLLKMVDPLQVSQLLDPDEKRRDAALKHLVGPDQPPVLFLPVNHGNTHWSLMVVSRQAEQTCAYHYDSISADRLVTKEQPAYRTSIQVINEHTLKYVMRRADREKLSQVQQVADLLGAGRVENKPMAQQHDNFSCGSYVLTGIYKMALALAQSGKFQLMDLERIRPDHSRTIEFLQKSALEGDAQRIAPAPDERSAKRQKV